MEQTELMCEDNNIHGCLGDPFFLNQKLITVQHQPSTDCFGYYPPLSEEPFIDNTNFYVRDYEGVDRLPRMFNTTVKGFAC